VRVNVAGIVNCVKAAMPAATRQRSGRIVNIASVSAMRGGGSVGNTIYAATKARPGSRGSAAGDDYEFPALHAGSDPNPQASAIYSSPWIRLRGRAIPADSPTGLRELQAS
jgi:hypothetical protein